MKRAISTVVCLGLLLVVVSPAFAQDASPTLKLKKNKVEASASPEASVDPTPDPSEDPDVSPIDEVEAGLGGPTDATDSAQADVLGETTVLGETSAGLEMAKWLLAGVAGMVVLLAGFRAFQGVTRGEDE
ncbi:hypothetical protein C4579_02595 [Candidatus Microgenomates bacterium]|nr:MAG: hypothetical protein C4579_02595 [Candidatus Microgenomates bacterium]